MDDDLQQPPDEHELHVTQMQLDEINSELRMTKGGDDE